ncbi:MAG: hypothetical protein ACP5VQ_06640 [Phycisphaerae bacterium]
MTDDTVQTMRADETSSFPARHQVLFGFLRQTRYVVACIVVGIFFLFLAGKVIPSPNMDGARALAAGPALSLAAELAMLGGLIVAVIIGTLLTWPDAPHTGLFVSSVGLIFLACHWGSVTLLLALRHADLVAAYHTMALQNIFWFFYILLGEVLARGMYEFIGSRSWPLYLGLPWPITATATDSAAYPSFAGILADADPLDRRSVATRIRRNMLAFVVTIIVAVVLLFLLLKSQQPGQAIFACSVAFAAGAFIAAALTPQAEAWVIWITPPCIAAAGGILAPHFPQPYPAHAGLFLVRTLPIYYSSAGVAGAIVGYYAAVRMYGRRAMDNYNAAVAAR